VKELPHSIDERDEFRRRFSAHDLLQRLTDRHRRTPHFGKSVHSARYLETNPWRCKRRRSTPSLLATLRDLGTPRTFCNHGWSPFKGFALSKLASEPLALAQQLPGRYPALTIRIPDPASRISGT
jgi:hypothetical protein